MDKLGKMDPSHFPLYDGQMVKLEHKNTWGDFNGKP